MTEDCEQLQEQLVEHQEIAVALFTEAEKLHQKALRTSASIREDIMSEAFDKQREAIREIDSVKEIKKKVKEENCEEIQNQPPDLPGDKTAGNFNLNEISQKTPRSELQTVAPRYHVNLRSSVLISATANPAAEEDDSYFAFQGQLRDVSLSGLAIIISFEDMLELKLLGEEISMHLLLPLPVQAIELDAMPVRYQHLNEGEQSDVLIGAQITNMNGRDRVLFMEFIREFED